MTWYLECIKKYAVFSGRASRTEYWVFSLINFVITLLLAGIFGEYVYCIYLVFILIPSLAVLVRRLHDIGMSGAFILVALVPYVGTLFLLICECIDSQPGTNKYGPNPKGIEK